MRRAQEEYDAYIAEHFRRGAMRHLTADERQAILQGLKKNWEEIHEQYQGISVVTDTAPKKNRKERMEAEMKQLERDIETVERHSVIYIAN
jgi:ribosome recycling factor